MREEIFNGNVDGRDCKVIIDRKGSQVIPSYTVFINVPKTKSGVEKAKRQIENLNQKQPKKGPARLVALQGEDGEPYPYIKIPVSMLEARYFMFSNRKENLIKSQDESGLAISNSMKKAMAGILATTILGTVILVGHLSLKENLEVGKPPVLPTTTIIQPAETTTPTILPDIKEPEQTVEPTVELDKFDFDSIELSDLTYDTYQNSAGNTMYELDDSLFISYVCYNKVVKALNDYNESVSADKRYSFDASKFNSTMFTGEQIRESSLKQTLNDFDDLCRGPFKIGPDAIKEANIVSKNLFGTEIISTEEDLYDPVKSCMACVCIAIKNYEYCAGVTNEVTPNMVFDTYLYGCGNIRKELKNNSYEPKSYSKEIIAYGEVLEDYFNSLMKGETDGSHDRIWNSCYLNLYDVPNMVKNAQLGE